MRILHTADIHLAHDWFDWIASNCADFDLLVIAGDLQNAFSNVSLDDQVKAIRTWLLALSTRTIVCSGNHDHWVAPRGIIDVSAEGRWLSSLCGHGNIVATDGDSIRFQDVEVVVNGWGQRYNGRGDLLVTHAPPSECPCAMSDDADFGDPTILDATASTLKLILAGHIHFPATFFSRLRCGSVVLVPGYNDQSSVPSHWIIDTKQGQASHSSGALASFSPMP